MWWRPLTHEFDAREAYALHSDDLYGFAVRALGEVGLAEEALEETFLRAWTQRDPFDPEGDSLRGWLFTILREVLIDLGHPRAADPAIAEGGMEPSVEAFEQSFVAWQIEEAMRRVEEQYRQILVETYYRALEEIALER